MKRLALTLAVALLGAGCVVHTPPASVQYTEYSSPPPVAVAPPPPAPATQVYYHGEHFIPDAYGGGWCYEDGPHVHDYYPDRADAYYVQGGYYYYNGPYEFSYMDGHPVPGGGWCYVRGRHAHDYNPPRGADWRWLRSSGYVYRGPYRPTRPPPATYWPRVRPAPAPSAAAVAAPYIYGAAATPSAPPPQVGS